LVSTDQIETVSGHENCDTEDEHEEYNIIQYFENDVNKGRNAIKQRQYFCKLDEK